MTRVLSIGAGGLGSPVLVLLARSVDVDLTIVDDDVVDVSNLHRQILYREPDVGRPKLEAAARRIDEEASRAGRRVSVTTVDGRVVPDNVRALFVEHDLVVEGADNFATKFLSADAAHLSRVPIVHAGVVRWAGFALAVRPGGTACLRCLFEDLPRGAIETCATAGVVGPVVGAVGALAASLAIRLVLGDADAAGTLFHHDARRGTLRRSRPNRRAGCTLCGASPSIESIDATRYGAHGDGAADCAAE